MGKPKSTVKPGSVRDAWDLHESATSLLALLPTLPVDPECLSPLPFDSDVEDTVPPSTTDSATLESATTHKGLHKDTDLSAPSSWLMTADDARSHIYTQLSESQKTIKALRSSASLRRRATDPCFTHLPTALPELWERTERCYEQRVEAFKRQSALTRLYGKRAPRGTVPSSTLTSSALGASTRAQKRPGRAKRVSNVSSRAYRARTARKQERKLETERQEVWEYLKASMMLAEDLFAELLSQQSDGGSTNGRDDDGDSDVDMEAPPTVEERFDAEEAELLRLALLARDCGVWLDFELDDEGTEVGLSCMWQDDDYEVARLLARERPPISEKEYRDTVQRHSAPKRSDSLSSTDRASDTSSGEYAKAGASEASAVISDSSSSPSLPSPLTLR